MGKGVSGWVRLFGKGRDSEKGQASVMIGMMMLTFILFFAFVVNTGMLVNAKINLQNAADLAAYSGASQQARLLNEISYLNYEMRRAYKKFLFRYYVLGNMSQISFPSGGGSGGAVWSPDGNAANSYQVPSVCMIFNSKDNYCQVSKLAKIAIPPSNPLDAINTTLVAQLKKLDEIRRSNCQTIGKTNTLLLFLWLYNADPTLQQLSASLQGVSSTGAGDAPKVIDVIRGLASGLGLLPRELLLRQRIKTLTEYVNAAPLKGLTKDVVEGYRTGSDPMAKERSVNAFLSAYNTLSDNIFSDDTIQLDELMPAGNAGARLLTLKDIKADFDTYAVDFSSASGTLDGTTAADCNSMLVPVRPAPVPVGVYKDPTVLTYYAVRLRAKAKIMFSPFGDVDLKAYAAARPFGSRIGPVLDGSAFTVEGTPRQPDAQNVSNSVADALTNYDAAYSSKRIPYLPVKKGDGGRGTGWDSQEVLHALFKSLRDVNANGAAPVDINDYKRAIQAAMAPNPYEGNLYNIPNDTNYADPFVRNFDKMHMASIWAPVLPLDKMSSVNDELEKAIKEAFPQASAGVGAAQGAIAAVQQAMQTMLPAYVTGQLMHGTGEDQEGYKIARFTDPFYSRADDPANGGGAAKLLSTSAPTLNKVYLIGAPSDYKTSWDAVADASVRKGRVGYSVKFVAFDTLAAGQTNTNGKAVHENGFDAGAEGDSEIPYIKH